jgi:GR25 family glycosyltransferase involved in LPS biosynthesis
MKFYTYLVAWDEVHFNAVEIDEQFMAAGQPITVINSGNMKRDHWDNVGDIRYYRQFYHALKSFDTSYDYMAFLCGDVSYSEWSKAIERANYILSTYKNTGLYAPHLTHEPWSEGSSKIGGVLGDDKINISIQTDGIYVFIHRDIVKVLLEYFNFLNDNIDLVEMKSGWGLDMIWSSISIVNGLPILRDKQHVLSHPAGSSYDHSRATEEMNIMLSIFYSYLESNGIDSEIYKIMHGKIYGRMSQHTDCMDILDFYSELSLFKKIDYHIIHINDERKSNRDKIQSVVNGNLKDIFSLNANDPEQLEKFYLKNKYFKKAWDGFKPGELGNFGSHYSAWQYVIDNDLDSLLVFEDDASIHSDFIGKYNTIMYNVPEDYDVMSIFVDPNQYSRCRPDDYINDYITKGYQDWSTLCYVVSRQGAKKLVKYVNEIGMDHPTDWFIFRKGHAGIFNVYTVPPEFPSPLEIDHSYESQVQ